MIYLILYLCSARDGQVTGLSYRLCRRAVAGSGMRAAWRSTGLSELKM